MTHKRNGTATLFAALNVADGTVISMCDDRHRHQEWLQFLRVIDQVTRGFHVHFTPTSSSWRNMVERFFPDLTQNRLRSGVFRDVEELITPIGDSSTVTTRIPSHSSGPPRRATSWKK